MPAASPKLRRWIDLLAALLRRHAPATLEELVPDVPGYRAAGRSKAATEAVRRKFERDKDELRAYGIPIQTVKTAEQEVAGYRLPAMEFYLPYLSLAGGSSRPEKITRYGYLSLPELAFEADELAAVAGAASRVRSLGIAGLAADVASALRKLACDLPVDAAEGTELRLVPPRAAVDDAVFDALAFALEKRKRVTFDYFSMGSGASARRTVEPFGLFFLNQHWYLAARGPGEEAIKNYRLSRISRAAPAKTQIATADYAIPKGFRLEAHARSRHAWELGDGDAVEAIVEFRGAGGALTAARKLGDKVPGAPDLRAFQVRRLPNFARWLLALGGNAIPISPKPVVTAFRSLAKETLALYQGAR